MKQQLTCIFLLGLVIGSYGVELNQKAAHKQSIITENKDSAPNVENLLEEGSNYVVDEVLSLLKSLEQAARQDLTELVQSWNKQKVLLEAILQQAVVAHRRQKIQCHRIDKVRITIESEIKIRREEIHINEVQIEKNKLAIIQLNKERCESNTAYINHIISHQDALSLFEILKEAIEQYRPGTFIEMIQLKKVANTLGDYLNHYASQHTEKFQAVLAQIEQIGYSNGSGKRSAPKKHYKKRVVVKNHPYQQFKGRQIVRKVNDYASKYDGKEINVGRYIGNKHIDNKRGQIKLQDLDQQTVRSLANIKGQLIKILNQLIEEEKKNKVLDENQEYKSNIYAAKIKSMLQLEIRMLTRRNRVLVREITIFTVRLTKRVSQLKICRYELEILLDTKTRAQKNLVDATARFRKTRSILVSEIGLFNKLYIFYRDRVYYVATKADKERIQDHVDNHNFKHSGEYTKKQAYKFNPLRNHVASTITSEANSQVA